MLYDKISSLPEWIYRLVDYYKIEEHSRNIVVMIKSGTHTHNRAGLAWSSLKQYISKNINENTTNYSEETKHFLDNQNLIV